jgi:NADH dehydrogenase
LFYASSDPSLIVQFKSGAGKWTMSQSSIRKTFGHSQRSERKKFRSALIAGGLKWLYPLFGDGETRLQPVYVGDVAEAVAGLVGNGNTDVAEYEFGGRRDFSYKELVREIGAAVGRRPVVMPMPFAVWHAAAAVAEFLPGAPMTRNQVQLMRYDNVPLAGMPGLKELGIEPCGIEVVIAMTRRSNSQKPAA